MSMRISTKLDISPELVQILLNLISNLWVSFNNNDDNNSPKMMIIIY